MSLGCQRCCAGRTTAIGRSAPPPEMALRSYPGRGALSWPRKAGGPSTASRKLAGSVGEMDVCAAGRGHRLTPRPISGEG